MKVQLVCISASGTSVISPLGVLEGILVLHFESEHPRKTINCLIITSFMQHLLLSLTYCKKK